MDLLVSFSVDMFDFALRVLLWEYGANTLAVMYDASVLIRKAYVASELTWVVALLMQLDCMLYGVFAEFAGWTSVTGLLTT
jgi:hypothetical protein